ncbi:uncharacterized protein [Asterias amurensis]|uniref:uncharacterized protein n=1 Tax=Asterias amurensis TaxID=7602 RepID=UPI003AB4E858
MIVNNAPEDCSFVTEATRDRRFEFILNPLVTPFRLSFDVKAPSRAMILLASERTSGSVFAEIAIGYGNNQGAFIRTCYSGDPNCDKNYKPDTIGIMGLVSSEEFRAFWVAFSKEGVLTVGKGGKDASLLEWDAGWYIREYLEVHVGIGTFGDGERGDWVFHAFCE